MNNYKLPSQEQVLGEIKAGFLWLNKYKDRADDMTGNFAIKYHSFLMKMVGEVDGYLRYWDHEEFLRWFAQLGVDESVKWGFYDRIRNEDKIPF